MAKKQYEIANKLLEIYTGLARTKTVPIETLLQQQLVANQAAKDLREAQESIRISKAGRPLSVQAAELDLQEAKIKYQLHTQVLQDFKIYAPADGMVAQVLAHEGEYNQNAGSSAFVLAVGKWFGGNFDQTTIGRFAEGTPVNVRLEAFPGRVFEGRVRKIKPMVTYNPGGPEAARPIRPLGTGSPEWPATFITRIELAGDEQQLHDIVPGLTGFAEVKVERRGPAVPEGSLTSISGGKAMIYVVDGDRFHVQEVAVGQESDGWVEVTSGSQAWHGSNRRRLPDPSAGRSDCDFAVPLARVEQPVAGGRTAPTSSIAFSSPASSGAFRPTSRSRIGATGQPRASSRFRATHTLKAES